MTTATTVEALCAGMIAAAAAASKIGPDILDGFVERLLAGLGPEDEQTRATVINIVAPILADMNEQG